MTTLETLDAEKLLRDLAGLWVTMGNQQSEYAVLRACSMTLFAATVGTGDGQELNATIGDLMRDHPSRAIVIRVTGNAAEMQARVFAQCQLAFERRQQICCEQIEITSGRDRLHEVYNATLALTVPDLPVVLWLKDAQLLGDDSFAVLLKTARSLVLDSTTLPDAAKAITAIRSRAAAGWRMKDLSWTRLTPWREAIAQAYANKCSHQRGGEACIEVRHAGDRPSTECLYLAAWLALRTPEAPVTFVTAPGQLNGPVQGVKVSTADFQVEIRAVGEASVEVDLSSISGRLKFPPFSDAELLLKELSILYRDASYESALERAAQFTQS